MEISTCLDECKRLTSKNLLRPALAALRQAFAMMVERERAQRGGRASLTSFSSSLVSGLLYRCWASGDPEVLTDARSAIYELYSFVFTCPGAVPSLPQPPLDERTATLSLRVLQRAGEPRETLLGHLRNALTHIDREASANPDGGAKRRMFAPLVQGCESSGEFELAMSLVKEASARGVRLRDTDFESLLRCARASEVSVEAKHTMAKQVAEAAAPTQLIVGRECARLFETLLPSAKVVSNGPSVSGSCPRCHRQFGPYRFDDDERCAFLDQIVDRLVRPYIQRRAAAHPETVNEQAALDRFVEFKHRVDDLQCDGVIDGANVGFFGLSSWYNEAKCAERIDGDASSTSGSNTARRIGTDVAPNFLTIDSAVAQFMKVFSKCAPTVFLHERHLSGPSLDSHGGRNREVLNRWRNQGIVVVPTPSNINDDLCWMYAAVKHRCMVVTNDQMRDHHFGLLAPESFLKWRSTMQVQYSCKFDSATAGASVALRHPNPCATAISIRAGDDSMPDWRGIPGGLHIPCSSMALQEETGKLLPGSTIPQGTVLVPESRYDLHAAAPRLCSGWICCVD